MNRNENLKKIVKSSYGLIARNSNKSGCCNLTGCDCETTESDLVEKYIKLDGYLPDANLKLGCGIPTEYANIKVGDSLLDLGSGAGNDCFVARAIVGDKGKITGLDFTDEMIEKAQENNLKLGYLNVKFIKGDIEQMPIADNQYDVVISNCVLNLVPDKAKAFSEIHRVLKPGGHFCVSDIVLEGDLPREILASAEMYASCIAGAIQKDKYIETIKNQGFKRTIIHSQIESPIPETELRKYLSDKEIKNFKKSTTGIFSITVSGYKL